MQLNEIKVGGLYLLEVKAQIRGSEFELLELVVRVTKKSTNGTLEIVVPPLSYTHYINACNLQSLG